MFDVGCSIWMSKRCELALASSKSQSGETLQGEYRSPSLALLLAFNSFFSSVSFVMQNWKKVQGNTWMKALSLKFIAALSFLETTFTKSFGKFGPQLEGLCVFGASAWILSVCVCLCSFVKDSSTEKPFTRTWPCFTNNPFSF
jgi:hypothetical protein